MSNNKKTIDMKTILFTPTKATILTSFGLLSILLTSCGSYQNKSYYDRDGIYVSEQRRPVQTTTQVQTQNEVVYNESKQKNYFGQLLDESKDPEIITDVNSYSSTPSAAANTTQNITQNNSGEKKLSGAKITKLEKLQAKYADL